MAELRGYHYHVSDEQIRVFRSLTPSERLRWLDDMRELTIRLAPPRTRRWWRKLREGN
jgi:hypothetical protein